MKMSSSRGDNGKGKEKMKGKVKGKVKRKLKWKGNMNDSGEPIPRLNLGGMRSIANFANFANSTGFVNDSGEPIPRLNLGGMRPSANSTGFVNDSGEPIPRLNLGGTRSGANSPNSTGSTPELRPQLPSSHSLLEVSTNRTNSCGTHDSGVPELSSNSCGETSNSGQKKFLLPDGRNSFFPSNVAANAITKVIRRCYNHPWHSWGEIPLGIREKWFKEFQKDVCWMPNDEDHMWRAFNQRGTTRLSDLLGEARSKNKRPDWILLPIWKDLWKYWSTPKFKEIQKRAKQNRAADSGGCLHTGGSISIGTHKRKLAKEYGREPTIDELFKHTHMKKKDREWVCPKAMNIHDEYKAKEAAQAEPCLNERVETSKRKKSPLDIWTETVGGMKKGRLYGLGSLVTHGAESSRRAPSQMPENMISRDELEQRLDQQKQEWEEKFLKQKKQFTRMMRVMKSFLNSADSDDGDNDDDEEEEEEEE